jgi:hypothetical protein
MLFSTTELRIADNRKDRVETLYTAEAGVSEIIARMEMDPGTLVNVNGGTIDAHIGDDPFNPDPNWRTEVYLAAPDSLPAPDAGETVVATVQPASNWLHFADAGAVLEPIVVEHKWVDLNANGIRELGELVLYDASRFPPENFVGGLPVETIRVPARLNGSRRTVRAEVTRFSVSAKAQAAITCDRGVVLSGDMAGCGHNHDLWTPANTKLPNCAPWELCANHTLDATEGCQVAVMTTGDDADTGGSSDLEGFPTWSDTSSSNPFYDIEAYLGISTAQWNEIRHDPDYRSANDAEWFDGVVIVDHDATGSEEFNGGAGQGLICVDGDMHISGQFEWRGLIYVEGALKITGNPWILGAVVVRGRTEDAFGAGSSTILYSRDAIQMFVGSHLGYQTLAWNEL